MTFTWGTRRVTSRTAPDGSITQWTYADDDVATRIEPSGNVTIWLYQPDGVDRFWPGRRPLRRKADLLGTIEERDHDAAGRLRSIRNGAGETLVLEYGIDQMVSGFADPAGLVTSFSDYGEHGHPGSVSRAGIVQSFMYDAVGNLTEGPDPASASSPSRGGIVSRGFDADRNVTVVTLTDLALVPLATETVAISFRSDRKPILIARPGGGDVRFVYDELGRLVRRSQRADGVWSDTTFGYDAAGRRTAVDRPNGMGQRWTYDSAGRVTTHAIRNGSDTENLAAFAWERGRLRLFADGRSGTEVYSYDQAGRLDTVEYGNGDRAGLAWDLRSRQTGLSLDQRGGARLRTLALAYDETGRERAVYEDGVPLIERTWSSGRLTRTEYGNGLVRQLGFDSELGTLSGATMTAGAGVIESTVVQVTDPECSIVASRCVSSQTTSTGAVSATSSERHHLVAADPDSLSGRRVGYEDAVEGGRQKIYHYDFLSNLRVGPSGGLRYNEEGNRLRDIDGGVLGAIHYDYDSAGFATRREGVPMTWDGAGRLASYGSATFEWDTLGRPVASTLSGTRTSRRFGGLVETDAVGDPVAIDLGEVRLDLAANGARYRHFDYRGNVKLVTDATGTVVEHYEYSAYAVEAVYGVAVGTRGFARGRTVGDLVLIGHRLYDPAAARFLAPDPIYQLINQYAYTLGNPVEFWDPSGAQSVTNEQAAGAMMEAAGNSFSSVGAATFVAGLGLLAVPVPGVNVFTSVTLVGVGLNFLVLGEGLKAFGSLLQSEGAGSGGSGGGIGAGPGLSASPGFPEHAPPSLPCGGDACAGGGAVGLGELATLANLGGPTAGVAAGGGSGCAPLALGEGRLSGEALALLLAANLVVAALLCGRSQRIRSARRGT
jgi:RHS repeat-associated protein